jgi:hypothetical protein
VVLHWVGFLWQLMEEIQETFFDRWARACVLRVMSPPGTVTCAPGWLQARQGGLWPNPPSTEGYACFMLHQEACDAFTTQGCTRNVSSSWQGSTFKPRRQTSSARATRRRQGEDMPWFRVIVPWQFYFLALRLYLLHYKCLLWRLIHYGWIEKN